MQQLELEVRAHGDYHVITARGEIDIAAVAPLRDTISERVVAGDVHLILDLDEVTFLDSTGLGVLIGARRKVHAFKGSFSIVCRSEKLKRLFVITSLDKVFAIHDSLAEALPADGERSLG